MAISSVLEYDSYTPNQTLLDFEPRDVYQTENQSIDASSDARSSVPDALETITRMRLRTKDSTIQSVLEHNLA